MNDTREGMRRKSTLKTKKNYWTSFIITATYSSKNAL